MIVFKRGFLAAAQLATPQRLIKSSRGSWCLVASPSSADKHQRNKAKSPTAAAAASLAGKTALCAREVLCSGEFYTLGVRTVLESEKSGYFWRESPITVGQLMLHNSAKCRTTTFFCVQTHYFFLFRLILCNICTR